MVIRSGIGWILGLVGLCAAQQVAVQQVAAQQALSNSPSISAPTHWQSEGDILSLIYGANGRREFRFADPVRSGAEFGVVTGNRLFVGRSDGARYTGDMTIYAPRGCLLAPRTVPVSGDILNDGATILFRGAAPGVTGECTYTQPQAFARRFDYLRTAQNAAEERAFHDVLDEPAYPGETGQPELDAIDYDGPSGEYDDPSGAVGHRGGYGGAPMPSFGPASNFWLMDGSVIKWEADGAGRQATYHRPSPEARARGITPGMLLFFGAVDFDAQSIEGELFIHHSPACGTSFLEAIGRVSPTSTEINWVGMGEVVTDLATCSRTNGSARRVMTFLSKAQ